MISFPPEVPRLPEFLFDGIRACCPVVRPTEFFAPVPLGVVQDGAVLIVLCSMLRSVIAAAPFLASLLVNPVWDTPCDGTVLAVLVTGSIRSIVFVFGLNMWLEITSFS